MFEHHASVSNNCRASVCMLPIGSYSYVLVAADVCAPLGTPCPGSPGLCPVLPAGTICTPASTEAPVRLAGNMHITPGIVLITCV